MKHLILASASPRRRQLLQTLGLPFSVCPARGEELLPPGTDPTRAALALAVQKAEEVFASHPGDLVLGADTVVAFGGKLLGKPASREEAFAMLSALSGRTHLVTTGVCLKGPGLDLRDAETARVTFRPWTEAEIFRYIDTGSPFDKAGGYGIQDPDGPVLSFEGNFDNIMGLPLSLPLFGRLSGLLEGN